MYRYETYNFRVAVVAFLILAVMFLIYREWVGAILSASLLFLFLWSYSGVEIDTEKGRYMRYDRFFRFRMGSWKPLPPLSYVTLVRIKLSSQRTMAGPLAVPEDTRDARTYRVNLVVDGPERYIKICRGNRERMTQEALNLGKFLGLRVLDYSRHEKRWIL